MRRTAKTEVTNDKMERSWKTESDSRSVTVMMNDADGGPGDDEDRDGAVTEPAC